MPCRGIRCTRGRPYKKNDQAWVEQRNWTAVRQVVGYDRYSSQAAFAQFTHLYPLLRDYLNFFQPLRKLISKTRDGATVTKHYDTATTPYRRPRATGVLQPVQIARLHAHYRCLNPVHLRRDIETALDRL